MSRISIQIGFVLHALYHMIIGYNNLLRILICLIGAKIVNPSITISV